jgi:hypothetical protein
MIGRQNNILKEENFLKKLPIYPSSFRSCARAAARGGRALATPSWAVLTPS